MFILNRSNIAFVISLIVTTAAVIGVLIYLFEAETSAARKYLKHYSFMNSSLLQIRIEF